MRILIFIALLCAAVQGKGQIYINSYAFGPSGPTELLLDSFGTGVQAAYALRKLDKDYTGNAVTIRRASNSDTLAIGFVGNELDTAAINTHCAGTRCTVRRWWDQSGNNRHALQTDTAKQPIIYETGAIVRTGGSANRPTIRWDGTADELNATISTLTNTSALCIFYAYSSNAAAAANTNTAFLWCLGTATDVNRSHGSSTVQLTDERMFFDVRTSSNGTQRLGSSTYTRNANTIVIENSFFLTSGTSFQQNNTGITLDLASGGVTTSTNLTPNAYNTSSDFCIGALPATVFINQKIAEMVIYNSDKSIDRSAINGNLNNYYSAY